jgi:HEAT repeat protein
MPKPRAIIIVSFLLLVFAIVWIFHREIIFSVYVNAYRNQGNKPNQYNAFIVSGLGKFIVIHSKHFQPLLLKNLGSSIEEKSTYAFYLLAEGNDISVDNYIKLFDQSPYYHTREKIIELLPYSDKSVTFLMERVRQPGLEPTLRILCVIKLGDYPDPRCPAFFEEMLKDPQPGVRAMSISLLARKGIHYYRDEILEMTRDKDPGVRQAAIDSLNLFGNIKIRPELFEALDDNDAYRILSAISSKNTKADKRAVSSLEKLIKTSKEENIRKEAQELLDSIKKE